MVIFKQMCSHQISVFCPIAKLCCVLVKVLAKSVPVSTKSVCKDSQINVQSTFIYEVKRTGTVNAVWPNMIKTKCAIVETRDDHPP